MRHTSVLLAALALAIPGFSQSQSKTLPAIADGFDGNRSTIEMFGYDAFHAQQVWDGTEIATTSALLNGLSLRSDAPNLPANAVTVNNVTVELSETTVTPFTMGTAFAGNETSIPTVVFQGSVNLPALPDQTFGPAPFSILIPFQAPFTFTTANGNLLVDVVANNPTPANRTFYSVDAAVTGGSVERYGENGELSGSDNLTQQLAGTAGYTSLVPGGSFDVTTLTNFRFTQYPGVQLLGLPLVSPVDLTPIGAPGNWAYVDALGSTPIAPTDWIQPFIGFGQFVTKTTPIPNDPAAVGAVLAAQSVLLDTANSNPFPLVTSEAGILKVGVANSEPTQMIAINDPNVAIGNFAFGSSIRGGAVMQFIGLFN